MTDSRVYFCYKNEEVKGVLGQIEIRNRFTTSKYIHITGCISGL